MVTEICPSFIAMTILQYHDVRRHQHLNRSDIVTVQRLMEVLDHGLYFGLGSVRGRRKGEASIRSPATTFRKNHLHVVKFEISRSRWGRGQVCSPNEDAVGYRASVSTSA